MRAPSCGSETSSEVKHLVAIRSVLLLDTSTTLEHEIHYNSMEIFCLEHVYVVTVTFLILIGKDDEKIGEGIVGFWKNTIFKHLVRKNLF